MQCGMGTLVEISQGLKVCLFLHCNNRIWGLGYKGLDCHSCCESAQGYGAAYSASRLPSKLQTMCM